MIWFNTQLLFGGLIKIWFLQRVYSTFTFAFLKKNIYNIHHSQSHMVKQWSNGTVYKTVIQTMSAFYHEQKEAKSFRCRDRLPSSTHWLQSCADALTSHLSPAKNFWYLALSWMTWIQTAYDRYTHIQTRTHTHTRTCAHMPFFLKTMYEIVSDTT